MSDNNGILSTPSVKSPFGCDPLIAIIVSKNKMTWCKFSLFSLIALQISISTESAAGIKERDNKLGYNGPHTMNLQGNPTISRQPTAPVIDKFLLFGSIALNSA